MSTRASRLLRPGTTLAFVAPSDTVSEAILKMIERNVGSVVVLDENEHLMGIFTERDLLRRVVGPGLDATTTPIRDVMTADIRVVDDSATREQVRSLMESEHIRHVPIVQNNRVLGVLSLRDVLRSENAEKTFEIDQLRGYVSNKPYPSYPG